MVQSKLFSPAQIGALELQHRVVMAPMTRYRATTKTSIPSEFAAEYYSQRASPGGLIITEGTFVAEEAGGFDLIPGIYSTEQITAWKKVTDAVHEKGGFIFCQLWALGRVADVGVVPIIWSAGTVPEGNSQSDSDEDEEDSSLLLTFMTAADIKRFVEHFRQAALNAIEAGFDGVEIHGANGYLIDQFLQSNTNDRTDSYGGSLENRLRFPSEVLDKVCSAIGASRVGIRMSPFSRLQGMREKDPLALFVPWAEAIVRAQPQLAYVHAVECRVVGSRDTNKLLQKKEDTLDPIRDIVKGAGVAFISAGGYVSEDALEHSETSGDLIAFGRYFISNPDLPARIKNGWALRKYDRSTFYTQTKEGYTDFPVYQAS